MALWPNVDIPPKGELTDPKHWYKPVRKGDQWVIRNLTKQQNLLGEYETKERAQKVIKAIASQNPRFRIRGSKPSRK